MKKLEEKDWKYWIPSAGRAENIKTVDYLLSVGVPKENINIMVRDDEYEAYNARYNGMTHILPEQKTKNIATYIIMERFGFTRVFTSITPFWSCTIKIPENTE